MRVVHSERHRLHDPRHEVQHGVPMPTFEVPARADAILAALVDDGGFVIEEPADHGEASIAAVHDARMIRFLEAFWGDWREAGFAADEAFPDSFPHPAIREAWAELESPCPR